MSLSSFQGGFVSINIDWDCNLDKGESDCVPDYSFHRLDDPNSAIAKGWNFRYVGVMRMLVCRP